MFMKYLNELIKLLIIVFTFQALATAQGACPSIYQRLSRQHSVCLPRSQTCNFLEIGLRDHNAERMEILRHHNELRSKVAMGQESRAGGLHTASDMLELTWDEELANIAQKWAEQCIFEHECFPCRASRGYTVGQNLAELTYSCRGQCEVRDHEWKKMIYAWYDEVEDFDKKFVPAIKFNPIYGHFVTMTWAETYRIGCGYASYTVGKNVGKQLYVCDYAPAAVKGNRLYKEDAPCSKCPLNSCCGGSNCPNQNSYTGLCHLSSTPPVLQPKQSRRFYCAFEAGDPNCQFRSEGRAPWELVQTVNGVILSTVVSEGQSAAALFTTAMYSKKGNCLRLKMRKGPNKDGDVNASILKLEFINDERKYGFQVTSNPPWQFIRSNLPTGFDGYFKLKITMKVPTGYPPQFFELKEIEFNDEPCRSLLEQKDHSTDSDKKKGHQQSQPSPNAYNRPHQPPSSSYSRPQQPPASSYSRPQQPPASSYSRPQQPPASSYSRPQQSPASSHSRPQQQSEIPKIPFRFFCKFIIGDPNCLYSTDSPDIWKIVQTENGNSLRAVLGSYQSSSVRFRQWIPIRSGSCLSLMYRRGPATHDPRGDSRVDAIFEVNGQKAVRPMWTVASADYMIGELHLEYDGYLTLEIRLNVPMGSSPQFLELKQIKITALPCGFNESDCICP